MIDKSNDGEGYTPPGSGLDLTERQVAIVKGMIERGDPQADIAEFFGLTNTNFIDIAIGNLFRWVRPAPIWELPLNGTDPQKTILAALDEAKQAITVAEKLVARLEIKESQTSDVWAPQLRNSRTKHPYENRRR